MLTPKEERVLTFIRGYIQSNGQAPTITELGRKFNRSIGTIHETLCKLENKGVVKRIPNVSRGIRLTESAEEESTNGMRRMEGRVENGSR